MTIIRYAWCPPRPSDNWRSVLCPIGSKRPYILPFGNRSQNKSGNWNGMAIGTFFHPFSPHFFRLQLNFTYMKRFSYLVSVKNITFKSSYNRFKIDIHQQLRKVWKYFLAFKCTKYHPKRWLNTKFIQSYRNTMKKGKMSFNSIIANKHALRKVC